MTTLTPQSDGPAGSGGAGPRESRTLGAMVLDAAATHKGTALEYKYCGRPAKISYPELGAMASEIARGLIALGIEPGDRVAILGLTAAEWTLADCGSLCAAAVVTPIYHTNSPEECAYVLGHSEARLVFCENAEQAAKIAQVRDRCPALEHVVLLNDDDGELTLDELRRTGEEVDPEVMYERLRAQSPDDLATLVYTSGTTGPPKGCMLTHGNFLSTTRAYAQQLHINETHSMYQFLPLAHVLARVAQMVVIGVGARLIYWSGDATKIADELAETAPTHFPAVPRIYEKMHGVIEGRMADAPGAQRRLFEWALSVGARARPAMRQGRLPDVFTDLQYRVAERLVLSKVKSVFGPELQLAMVGAAPVARELLEFFDACGILVAEGWGLTESCAAATINTPEAVRLGTVGKPLPGTEIKIASDGEILIRGPEVFVGYYKDPKATAETLSPEGWLYTGDLGRIDGDGFVAVTGRKKDLIITSSGKNITPVNIESMLRESRYTTEAVVYGDNKPYLVAMLTLDREESVKLAKRLGIATDPVTIATDPGVHAAVQKEVDEINTKLARIEQVKRFVILGHDLSQADGELTPTLKVKRSVVYQKYADLFNGLYEREVARR